MATSVPLSCIALEVNFGDYVEIIAGWHKGHTGLVIDWLVGTVMDSAKQIMIVEKVMYNQVRFHDLLFTMS